MSELQNYIGIKLVQARPMTQEEFEKEYKRDLGLKGDMDGYLVVYPDGYESWCPKEIFQEANTSMEGTDATYVKTLLDREVEKLVYLIRGEL